MVTISTLVTTREGFTFSNPKVDVKLNQVIDEYGKITNTIRLKELNEHIFFHYREKLLRIDDTNSENDILSKFLSSGKNNKTLIAFFQNYGYFFGSSKELYSLYSCDELFKLISRVKLLIELIIEVNNTTPNINLIGDRLLRMMLSYPVKVHDLTKDRAPKALYVSPEHEIRKYLVHIGALSNNNDFLAQFGEVPDNNHLYFVNNAFYNDINYQLDEIDNIELLSHLDFIELILNSTSIESIDDINGVNLSERVKITANVKNKEIVITAAKHLIKGEIDYHVKDINPIYDLNTMTGTWKIPDLLSAVYFSIFFLDHNFKVIKKCANPTCDTYFDTLHSNNRKIYCSAACANIMSQRKYRSKHKQK